MLKKRTAVFAIVLSCLLLTMLWSLSSTRIQATMSNKLYNESTYRYEVEIDTFANTETGRKTSDGIQVAIYPEYEKQGSSKFPDNYLNNSRIQLEKWQSEKRTGKIDTLILFQKPLSMEAINKLILSVDGELFESGVVGYANKMPFAQYKKEEGPLLTMSLEEIAASQDELAIEMAHEAQEASVALEIKGYVAIRIFTDTDGAAQLAKHPLVKFVDVTPQIVRDSLSHNRSWSNERITDLSIEMPVWSIDW